MCRLPIVICSILMLVAPMAQATDYGWTLGIEAESMLVQPLVIVEHADYSTHEFPGSYKLDTLNLGLSAGWEFRTWWEPMWLGLRGSVWIVGMDGLVFPVPRFNLTTRWDLTDWLSVGLEAPYQPGIGLLIAQHLYLFYGATDWLAEDDIAMRSVAVLWRSEL